MTKPQALIIDDNPLNVEVIATLLENAGLEAVFVHSPRQLPQVLDHLTDLRVIFLDLEMPNHDGFELHKELKQDRRMNTAPVIAYTVHTSEIERVRRAGFDGFLGKPLHPENFTEQLNLILSGKAVWEV